MEDNPQLLTLVHGVDRRGRPVIRAYTGNARHPVFQEYKNVVHKYYEKAARLSELSRNGNGESPYSVNNNSSGYCSHSSSPSTQSNRMVTKSPAIIPELKGMRDMVSRLRCSLAIHSGLGPNQNGELNFLPVIPVRCRKPPTAECSKKGFPKVKSATNKQDLKKDLDKGCHSAPQAKTLPNNTECWKGHNSACSKVKKKKRKKKKALLPMKSKPKLKPEIDFGPFRPISSKYLIT